MALLGFFPDAPRTGCHLLAAMNLCCGLPGCTQVAERTVEVVARLGSAAAFAALVRAFVALPRGYAQIAEAIAAPMVSLAGRL